MVNTSKLSKSESAQGDRLSNLPADVLCAILSNLSTKDSVRTSTLSTRWRNLWLSVSALDLDSKSFLDDCVFVEFMDRFMEFNQVPSLKRFKLIYDVAKHSHSDFVSRIGQVLKRGVCDLTILNKVEHEFVRVPLSLYSCTTLVNLTLYDVVFDNPESYFISLPCVKTMHLEAINYYNGDRILETLISSCPVLEELTIIKYPNDDFLELLCVRSQSLKRFKLESRSLHHEDPDVEIDAPGLEYMSISAYECETLIIDSIGPFAKVTIDVCFDVAYDDKLDIAMIRNFLTGISTVRELIISAATFEVIHGYAELEVLPQFSNLTWLDVSLFEKSWELFPTLLGCCSNLHSLVLEFDHLLETDETMLFSNVPQCFLSLEFVHLKTFTNKETASKMKVAKYFLGNCAVLKKLVLSESFSSIIREIQKIPKRSRGCKVLIGQPTSLAYNIVS